MAFLKSVTYDFVANEVPGGLQSVMITSLHMGF